MGFISFFLHIFKTSYKPETHGQLHNYFRNVLNINVIF